MKNQISGLWWGFSVQLLVLVIRLIAKCSTKLKTLEINYLIKGGSVSELGSQILVLRWVQLLLWDSSMFTNIFCRNQLQTQQNM